jgi:two-component system chemotaxis response regulator CheB
VEKGKSINEDLISVIRAMEEVIKAAAIINDLSRQSLQAVQEFQMGAEIIASGAEEQAKATQESLQAKVRAAALSNRKLIGSSGFFRKSAGEIKRQDESGKKNEARILKNEIVVIIGVSTGGPKTLMEILPRLPSDFPGAVLVVQHMPPAFTESFAKRLDQYCDLPVREAGDGASVEPGTITVAKGGWHLVVERDAGKLALKARLTGKPEDALYKPSVNVTMKSVLENMDGRNIIGVLLTGMGDDGADMMVEIRKKGGFTIAESEETAVVYGMPKAAIERGGADIVAPAYKIGDIILKKVNEYARFSHK